MFFLVFSSSLDEVSGGRLSREIDSLVAIIANDAILGQKEIEVSVRHETVFVNGIVSSQYDKDRISHLLFEYPKVRFVVNKIKVDPNRTSKGARTNEVEQQQEPIKARMISPRPKAPSNSGSFEVPYKQEQIELKKSEEPILARIKRGLDTLELDYPAKVELSRLDEHTIVVEGTVGSDIDAHKILSYVRSQDDVVSVSEKLKVEQKDIAPVQTGLDRELDSLMALYQPILEGHKVNFTVKDGVVTFVGSVPRHQVIDMILSDTLMIGGVGDVKSLVKIGE